MKKLTTTNYSAAAFNVALLVLRVGFGALLAKHGYGKLTHFTEYQDKFMNFIDLGPTTSLGLSIFAEFFCSLLLIIGLFTRLVTIPLIINMAVALFMAHGGDILGKGEASATYIIAFTAILLLGPGKFSADAQFK